MTGPRTSVYTLEPEPPRVVPPPEVTTTEILLEDAPRGVKTVANFAIKHGWSVRVTYARGWHEPKNASEPTLKHSLDLRISDPGTGVVVAGGFWYAKVDDNEPEYKADGAVVRYLLGKLSAAQLKFWLEHRTDPRLPADARGQPAPAPGTLTEDQPRETA